MSGALAQEIPFDSRRVPLERRITLKFQHRDGFVNEYAANVSLKGMFISAWVPEPCGSVFLFEVQVADRQRLIHGVGEVVWAREAEESPDRPSGMGIRFLKLDDASREVINGTVETHVGRGGTPFDPAVRPEGAIAIDELFVDSPGPAGMADRVDSVPAAGHRISTLVLDSRLHPLEGRAMARRGGRGMALLWTTLLALLGGSVLFVLFT